MSWKLIFPALMIISLWLIFGRKKDYKQSSSSALEIIQERLARGEITKEEFIQLKKALEKNM